MTDPLDMEDADLAAEYVLGVIDTDLRAQTAVRIERDPTFAGRVTIWQERLAGLNEAYEAEFPPARVKTAIDRRLFGKSHARFSFVRFLGGAIAAALVGIVLLIMVPPERTVYLADLAADETDYAFTVEITGAQLEVTTLSGDVPDTETLELWLIAGDAAPVSLGLLTDAPLPANRALIESGLASGPVTLAVSREPPGGSPTGAPTGPVVATGPLAQAS